MKKTKNGPGVPPRPQGLWKAADLAADLQTSTSAVYRRRSLGLPMPPAIKIGRSLRWDPAEVAAWCAANREEALR